MSAPQSWPTNTACSWPVVVEQAEEIVVERLDAVVVDVRRAASSRRSRDGRARSRGSRLGDRHDLVAPRVPALGEAVERMHRPDRRPAPASARYELDAVDVRSWRRRMSVVSARSADGPRGASSESRRRGRPTSSRSVAAHSRSNAASAASVKPCRLRKWYSRRWRCDRVAEAARGGRRSRCPTPPSGRSVRSSSAAASPKPASSGRGTRSSAARARRRCRRRQLPGPLRVLEGAALDRDARRGRPTSTCARPSGVVSSTSIVDVDVGGSPISVEQLSRRSRRSRPRRS